MLEYLTSVFHHLSPPTPRPSPGARHPAPITIDPSPVTARLAPFPCHPSSIRLVWPIKFVFDASKSAMDARDGFDNIWRQIFNQASSLHCCVTFTFWWLPDPLRPPYYAITRKLCNHRTQKFILISFRHYFETPWRNFRANGSAVAEKNEDKHTHTHYREI